MNPPHLQDKIQVLWMAIENFPDLHCTLCPSPLLSNLVSSSDSRAANDCQFSKCGSLCLLSLCIHSPYYVFSKDQLLYNLQNLTKVWPCLRQLPDLGLPISSSLHSHSSFGLPKYSRHASQLWDVTIYLSLNFNTESSRASSC